MKIHLLLIILFFISKEIISRFALFKLILSIKRNIFEVFKKNIKDEIKKDI